MQIRGYNCKNITSIVFLSKKKKKLSVQLLQNAKFGIGMNIIS